MRNLSLLRKSVIALGVIGYSVLVGPATWALEKSLPPPPRYYLLDESGVLKSQTQTAVRDLLSEHAKRTRQQVVVAIFSTLENEDLVMWTNKIYKHWGLGEKGKDNGVLLALFWKEHQVRIEVGYGLEGVLTDAKSRRLLAEILVPYLKKGMPDEGIATLHQ